MSTISYAPVVSMKISSSRKRLSNPLEFKRLRASCFPRRNAAASLKQMPGRSPAGLRRAPGLRPTMTSGASAWSKL